MRGGNGIRARFDEVQCRMVQSFIKNRKGTNKMNKLFLENSVFYAVALSGLNRIAVSQNIDGKQRKPYCGIEETPLRIGKNLQ